MKKFLNQNVNTIYLSLGSECNLNCLYCMQRGSLTQKSQEINKDIYPFIKGLLSNLYPSQKLRLIFFGGEPLLHFDKIKTIVKKLKNKKIHFQIITNGKLLNDESIKFFNKYNFGVQVSWDGSISEVIRGYNVVRDKFEMLYKIKNLSLAAVVNKDLRLKYLTAQMQNFADYYFEQTGRQLQNHIQLLRDTAQNSELSQCFNFEKFAQDAREFTKDFFIKRNLQSFSMFFKDILNGIQFFYEKHKGSYIPQLSTCGEGYTTLSLTLDGSILYCHNSDEKAGSIYSNYWQYLNNLLSQNYICKKTECSVYSVCRGGCPLVNKSQIGINSFCNFKKALYEPILDFVKEVGLNKEVLNVCN